jgi:hypothetical protein
MNWYSRFHLLNDPYDSFVADKTEGTVYLNFKSTLCICCFAKNMSEILMWSHYADNHRGVCLEWDLDESNRDRIFTIEYANRIDTLDKVELTASGELSLNVKSNAKFLTTKFATWSYEEEVRIILIEQDLRKNGKYEAFPGQLRAIYFGKNASQDDIDLVKHNSEKLRIKYFQVGLNEATMKNDLLVDV